MSFLYINWNVDPEIFSVGAVHLRYYGLLLVGGFIAAYLVLRVIFRRERLPEHLLNSLAITLVFFTVIGLRLGHCLFYEPDYYLRHPLEIILPFRFSPQIEFIGYQGLASHGGAIGILLGLWWWCRKYNKSYLWIATRIVIVVPLAGAFVRIGNLMNSEICGSITTLPWGFIFVRNGDLLPRHPAQLYEALIYFGIFFFMWYLYAKKLPQLKRGMLLGIFLLLLFSARFLIEFVKMPQEGFETDTLFNMGQWLSIPFILAGLFLVVWSWKKGKPERRPVNNH